MSSIMLLNLAQVDPATAVQTYDRAKDKIEAVQEKVETRNELRQEKVEETREQMTERLQTRFRNLNQKWSDHWSNVLDRLTAILEKIETKASEYDGDKTALNEAIANAKTAISAAQTAVDDLSDNDYTVELDSEDENFGQQLRTQIQTYREDTKAVWELVRTARESVHEAFQQLRLLFSNEE